jgi:hypothetical protein
MAQGFYSLEEAANLLNLSPEELTQKAQQHEVRAFADKGTWRFKAEDIDAMAQGGMPPGSSNEFDIGEPDAGSEFDVGAPPDSGYISLGPPTSGSALNLQGGGGGGAAAGGGSQVSLPNAFEPSGEFPTDLPAPIPDSGSGSDFELTMEGHIPGFGSGSPSEGPQGVLRLADSGLMPTVDLNLGNVVDQSIAPPSAPADIFSDIGSEPPVSPAAGGSDVRLSLETGSFEFDLKVDSSGRLGEPPAPRKKTDGPDGPSTGGRGAAAAGEDEVHLDFDAATIDDSMLLVGEQRPDSDVRIEPVSMARPGVSGAIPRGDDLMRTEEIDLDAELRKAEEQSRLAKAQPKSGPLDNVKTQLPGPAQPTQLPDLPASSPFELSEEDLQLPQGSKRGGLGTGSGSEFELTLAPEDQDMMSPLNLGDDEDVELGAEPARNDLGSGRQELSGINLGRPADSGISLEQGDSSRVDFELTLDDESMTGPRTASGKSIDSESEFELTIDDSLVMKDSPSGAQKDIFEETDFDVAAAPSSEDSGSQAVALDDTDLESSDFDLAIEDSSSTDLSADTSGSELMVLDEEGPRTKVKMTTHGSSDGSVDSSMESIDSMFDEELVAPEPEPEREAAVMDDEEERVAPGIPAAQAEWGVVPVLLLAPCVMMMMIAGMMAYELLHGMSGYRQATPQGGILVSNLSALFSGEEVKDR